MRVLEVKKGDYVLGAVYQYANGYQFRAYVSGRKGGRKYHDKPEAAIPAWARKQADSIGEVAA